MTLSKITFQKIFEFEHHGAPCATTQSISNYSSLTPKNLNTTTHYAPPNDLKRFPTNAVNLNQKCAIAHETRCNVMFQKALTRED